MFSCIYFIVASCLIWLICPCPTWYLETCGRTWMFGMNHRGCTGSLQPEQSCSVHKWMFSGKKKMRVEDISHTYLIAFVGRCEVHPEISNWCLIGCCWNQLLLSYVGAIFMKATFLLCWIYRLHHQNQAWLSTQGTMETLACAGLVFMYISERLTRRINLLCHLCSATAVFGGDLCGTVQCISRERLLFLCTDVCRPFFCNPVVAGCQKVKT